MLRYGMSAKSVAKNCGHRGVAPNGPGQAMALPLDVIGRARQGTIGLITEFGYYYVCGYGCTVEWS